ncbi:hypothetical protein COCCADRAFT_98683, partial [Bipolaris zeicola 26-R-13]
KEVNKLIRIITRLTTCRPLQHSECSKIHNFQSIYKALDGQKTTHLLPLWPRKF